MDVLVEVVNVGAKAVAWLRPNVRRIAEAFIAKECFYCEACICETLSKQHYVSSALVGIASVRGCQKRGKRELSCQRVVRNTVTGSIASSL